MNNAKVMLKTTHCGICILYDSCLILFSALIFGSEVVRLLGIDEWFLSWIMVGILGVCVRKIASDLAASYYIMREAINSLFD